MDPWGKALLLDGYWDLRWSVLAELQWYLGDPVADLRRRCQRALERIRAHRAAGHDRQRLYGLMWRHSRPTGPDPRGYVAALQFARRQGCHRHLDFGAGVGSGSILFARHGFQVVAAESSPTLAEFCEWRLGVRRIPAEVIELDFGEPPPGAFDIATVMESLSDADRVRALAAVRKSLQPGGFLVGRFGQAIQDVAGWQRVRALAPGGTNGEAAIYQKVPG